MTGILFCLYQNQRQRRQALNQAGVCVAEAERVPFVILLFLLLGLPLLISPSLFRDTSASSVQVMDSVLWWVKVWSPMWVMVTVVLYAGFYLPRTPFQLVGASVDAMQAMDPDVEPAPLQERTERVCLVTARNVVAAEQETAVRARRIGQMRIRGRGRRLRDVLLPFHPLIRLLSSSRDSSD